MAGIQKQAKARKDPISFAEIISDLKQFILPVFEATFSANKLPEKWDNKKLCWYDNL